MTSHAIISGETGNLTDDARSLLNVCRTEHPSLFAVMPSPALLLTTEHPIVNNASTVLLGVSLFASSGPEYLVEVGRASRSPRCAARKIRYVVRVPALSLALPFFLLVFLLRNSGVAAGETTRVTAWINEARGPEPGGAGSVRRKKRACVMPGGRKTIPHPARHMARRPATRHRHIRGAIRMRSCAACRRHVALCRAPGIGALIRSMPRMMPGMLPTNLCGELRRPSRRPGRCHAIGDLQSGVAFADGCSDDGAPAR
jgi:hypothetical protein